MIKYVIRSVVVPYRTGSNSFHGPVFLALGLEYLSLVVYTGKIDIYPRDCITTILAMRGIFSSISYCQDGTPSPAC